MKIGLSLATLSLAIVSNGQAANILLNSSFEGPVGADGNGNNLNIAPDNWAKSTSSRWNLVRVSGTGYIGGPDTALDGNQYLDLDGPGEVIQTFTLSGLSDLSFGASFSNREASVGGTSTVGIYNAAGDTLISALASATVPGTSPSNQWFPAEETLTNLAAGTYQIRVDLDNFNNVDSAFVDVTAIPEPSSLALAALGGLGLLIRRRK